MDKKNDGYIVVAGLMLMDIIVKPVDKSVFDNDTNRVDSIEFLTGGDAMNVAVNLAKLGEKVQASALLGTDAAGDLVQKTLSLNGVDCSILDVNPEVKTSVSLVLTRPDGERNFACKLDSTDHYNASKITDEVLDNAKALYIGSVMELPSLEGGPLKKLFEKCRERGILTAIDAAGSKDCDWLAHIEDFLPLTDVFIPSQGEAVRITGTEDPIASARFLRNKGVRIAGIKLGEKGCYIESENESFFLPSIHCSNVVDLTGAGDAFMSGFVYGILQNWSIKDCAKFGTGMSYSAIQSLGASSHNPTVDKILSYAAALKDE